MITKEEMYIGCDPFYGDQYFVIEKIKGINYVSCYKKGGRLLVSRIELDKLVLTSKICNNERG